MIEPDFIVSGDAEQNVIGCLLQLGEDRKLYDRLNLTREDFFYEHHRLIFRAVELLHTEGMDVDPISVARKLHQHGKLEECGGRLYLDTLLGGCTLSGVRSHARMLREDRDLREVHRGLLLASECVERRDLEAARGVLRGLVGVEPANVVPLRKAA